jgi:hypothetical protein
MVEFFTQGRKDAKSFIVVLVLLLASSAAAQSQDPNAPSPVRSSTVTGRIPARDLGDARLTDHYYAFTGTPGDLLITVQSNNLNGDVDVFTAGTLRPLLKITLYAEITAPVIKGIYLRKREELILRIEARSPNDDDGTYRLAFGGSFEPMVGGPDIAETETPTTETPVAGRKGKRVSSVGATIEQPAPPATSEVAAAPTPTPEPTPEPTPVETPKTSEKPAATPAPRTVRTRRGVRRVIVAPPPKTPPTTQPQPASEPEAGPRLVIETNDGTLINRSMTSVRRVTIENGQVVINNRDGTINRILLANIVRMSIAP